MTFSRLETWENSFDYRGFTIQKTISRTGATLYRCEIETGSVSVAVDVKRILGTIDQKLTQKFLEKLPR